jgi:hypothetical protein
MIRISTRFSIGDKISSFHFSAHYIIVNKLFIRSFSVFTVSDKKETRTRTGVVSDYHTF